MIFTDLAQFAFYIALLCLLAPPLGWYMADVYEGRRTFLTPVLAPLENLLYMIVGATPKKEQSWSRYALCVVGYNLIGFLILYAILRFQHLLPWNPAGKSGLTPDLSFNTAVSFVTNTNWQS